MLNPAPTSTGLTAPARGHNQVRAPARGHNQVRAPAERIDVTELFLSLIIDVRAQ